MIGETSVTAGETLFYWAKKIVANNYMLSEIVIVFYQKVVSVPNLSSSDLVFFSCVCHFQVSSLENLLAAYSDATGIKGNINIIIIIRNLNQNHLHLIFE